MSFPVYGRYQVAEAPSNLMLLHTRTSGVLRTSDFEPRVGVLDQSDLVAQGILTDELVKGAKRVTGLGSCTANTFIEAASLLLSPAEFAALCARLLRGTGTAVNSTTALADVVGAEKAAILFYMLETHQTGDPSTEWPPTDCGSSGQYIVSEAQRQGACSTQRVAHGMEDVLSLMQDGGVMCGSPFFFAWEEPDSQGFIDGKGTVADLERAIASGVAGGHEYHLSAIEKITMLPTGQVDLFNTVIRWRNHWSRGWGDNGSGRVHASTLSMLGGHNDYRQIVA